MPRTITLPLERARRIARAIIPHVSADGVTPTLTVASVQGRRLVATDRYGVGVMPFVAPLPRSRENLSAGEQAAHNAANLVTFMEDFTEVETFAEPFHIPAAALRQIAAFATRDRLIPFASAVVRITSLDATHGTGERGARAVVTVDITEEGMGVPTASRAHLTAIGAFPSVARLLDEWEPAEEPTVLRLSPQNLSKVTRFAERYEQVLIEPGKPKSSTAARLAPVRITIGEFQGLLQPMVG